MELGQSDIVAGILAAASLFVGLAAILWTPFLLAPIAIIVGLIAAGMSNKWRKLAMVSVAISGISFVVGASLASWHGHSLY